jgi:hypothetical protein
MSDPKTKLEKYVMFLIVLVPLFTLAFSAMKYIDVRELEQKQRSFENYHGLIEKLDSTSSMDAQTAILYELRNYPEYKDVSIRILTSYQAKWKVHEMLITELNLTINELKNK